MEGSRPITIYRPDKNMSQFKPQAAKTAFPVKAITESHLHNAVCRRYRPLTGPATHCLAFHLHYLPETASQKCLIYKKLCTTPLGVMFVTRHYPHLAIFIACYVVFVGKGLGRRLDVACTVTCILRAE